MAAPSDMEYELHVLMISKSKLKSSIRSSTLLAGFAIVGIVEIDFDPKTPPGLLIVFAIHSAVLVFIHLLSLMLATFILPELEAVSDLANFQHHTSALDIAKCFTVQLCWILSNVIGIIILITEIILVGFIKFHPTEESSPIKIHAATGTVIILVILSLIAIPLIIYQSRVVAKHKLRFHERRLGRAQQMLDNINMQLDPMAPPSDSVELPPAVTVSSKSTLVSHSETQEAVLLHETNSTSGQETNV